MRADDGESKGAGANSERCLRAGWRSNTMKSITERRASPMRITSKGQVTIPQDIREKAGLLPHTDVDFEFDGKIVRIVKARDARKKGRGARIVEHLRGRGDVFMTTDEIMALTRA
jgi:AbrB family looped-hinge helix DNA binding protein